MPHAQLFAARVTRDAAIRRVLPTEARLIAIHYSAGADHRDPARRDGFDERSKRCGIVLDPSVGSEIAIQITRARSVCDWHGEFRSKSYDRGKGFGQRDLGCEDFIDANVPR